MPQLLGEHGEKGLTHRPLGDRRASRRSCPGCQDLLGLRVQHLLLLAVESL